MSPDRKGRPPAWVGNWSRVAVAAVFGWSTAVYPVLAQTPPSGEATAPRADAPAAPAPAAAETVPAAPAPAAPEAAAPGGAAPPVAAPAVPPADAPPTGAATAAPPVPAGVPPAQAAQAAPELYTLSELEYLLGPIALYPDPLLAVLFPATAFADQLVAANSWIKRNPNTVKAGNFSGIDAKPWDSSVKALTRFPDVVDMLASHMEWTESLGFAFINQPQDVSNTIQMLRAKAQQAGNLETTPQQVVTTREEGGRSTIYIQPADPQRIYVPTYDSSTIFTTFATGALVFGTAALVGSAWNNRWGWNNRGWNTVWVAPPAWHRPPHWGPGQRPPAWGPGPWRPRPDRPGPGRPDAGRPGRPDAGRPGLPDRPNARPPSRPGERPGISRPDGNRPNVNRPTDRPGAGQNRPQQRPSAGGSQRPANRPTAQRPRPNTQKARPRQQARPKQRAQTRSHSRPQQHRARPQGHQRRR